MALYQGDLQCCNPWEVQEDDTPFRNHVQFTLPPVSESLSPAEPRQLPQVKNLPRHSGQQQWPAMQPNNVYGDEAPVDILWHYDDIDVNRTPSDQSPYHPSIPRLSLSLSPVNGIMANIFWEGGAKLIYYL